MTAAASSAPATRAEPARAPLLLLRERFRWMGEHSGYDGLFTRIDEAWPGRVESVFRTRSAPQNLLFGPVSLLTRPRTPFYNGDSAAAELAALRAARRHGSRLVHVAYVENNLRLLATRGRRAGLRKVGTVHQPAAWWRARHRHPELLAGLDAVICLCREQAAYFESLLPGRVHVVPHGVDLDFFCPAPGADPPPARCVFSGVWMRDLPLLRRVVEGVLARRPRTGFDLLVPRDRRREPELRRLARHPQVAWHQGLSDAELRQLYRGARLLLLPLRDATANNALLEAMACGLPIVTSDVAGVREYTEPAFAARAAPGDAAGMTRAVLELLEDPERARSRGRLARAHAERHLGWRRAAARTAAIYREVLRASA